MEIVIDDKKIEEMVKEQVDKTVRSRIKEMQGDYTSKGYIESVIREVIWDKILSLCPTVEELLHKEISQSIGYAIKQTNVTKTQLVNMVVDGILNNLT